MYSLTPRHEPFATLRIREFRWYLAGMTLSALALTTLATVMGYQVFSLTGSFAALATLAFTWELRWLTMIPAGAMADTYDRRRIIVISEAALAAALAVVAVLTAFDVGGYALLFVVGLLRGAGSSFGSVARRAILPAIVGEEHLQHALIWRSSVPIIGAMLGPAIGGAAIRWGSPALAFACISGCGLLACLAFNRMSGRRPQPEVSTPRAPILEGFRVVGESALLVGVIAVSVTVAVSTVPEQLLFDLFFEMLRLDDFGVALLQTASGIGVLVMLLALTARRPIARPGRVLVLALVISIAGVVVSAAASSIWIAASGLLLVALAGPLHDVLTETIVLGRTPDRLRGRVIAVFSLVTGLMATVASWAVATAIDDLGRQAALILVAALVVLGAALVAVFARALWRYEPPSTPAPEASVEDEPAAVV